MLEYEEPDKVYTVERRVRKEFFKTIRGLWHQLLKSKRNSAFWILGGDIEKKVSPYEPNLWSVVIADKLETKQELPIGVRGEWDHRDQLHVEDLLREVPYQGRWLEFVFKTYARIESCQYSLKRYEDDLSRSLDELDESLDYLKGLCHLEFKKHADAYAKAYVIQEMSQYIYGGMFPGGGYYPHKEEIQKWGPYLEVMHSECFVHKMKAHMCECYRDFEKQKKLHRQLIETYHDKTLDTLKGQQLRFICALSLIKLDEYGEKCLLGKLKQKKAAVTKSMLAAIKEARAWKQKQDDRHQEDYSRNHRDQELSVYRP